MRTIFAVDMLLITTTTYTMQSLASKGHRKQTSDPFESSLWSWWKHILTLSFYLKHQPKIVPKLLDIHHELAWQMLDHIKIVADTDEKYMEASINIHTLLRCPLFQHPSLDFGKQKEVLAIQVLMSLWPGCHKQTYHYCICIPAFWLSSQCHFKKGVYVVGGNQSVEHN